MKKEKLKRSGYARLGEKGLEDETSALLSCTDSSQPGWFHVETYQYASAFLDCDTAGAKVTIKRVRPAID